MNKFQDKQPNHPGPGAGKILYNTIFINKRIFAVDKNKKTICYEK